ncbi:MAG: terpene cyclase/mutase family protein [Rhodocyclaceae bacterium]|nr:terpene cyclase/mutase family protein [Rhodocyclaceae bacterium]
MIEFTLAPILEFVLRARGWQVPDRLAALAAMLPAVPCAGVEFPLAGDLAMDLQQRLKIPADLARLEAMAAQARSDTAAPAAFPRQALSRLCEFLRGDSRYTEVWLELDAKPAAGIFPLSVFLRLAKLSSQAQQEAIEDAAAVLDLALPDAGRTAVARSLGACPPGAAVTHVGFMLGRPGQPLRLVIERVPFDGMADYLARAGWPGDAQAAQRQVDWLFTHADRIRLALAVSDGLRDELGFECFVGRENGSDPRFACLLDLLMRQGYCSPEARRRVLAWPAPLTPVSVTEAWPTPLMLDALIRGGNALGWLDCRISHIKLSTDRNRPAKAYLGFVDAWESISHRDDGAILHAPAAAPRRPVHDATRGAMQFLLASRGQGGWWHDYDKFFGTVSDEWVSAYAAHALAETGDPEALRAARRTWDLLERRVRGGWGWNHVQPADADSTLWVLLLAARLGKLESKPAREGEAFIRAHMSRAGGVCTYNREHCADWTPGRHYCAGWFEAHACVTAAVAAYAPLREPALNYLRQTQLDDGAWQGYWWLSPYYTTCHAAEALALGGMDQDRARIARAAAWAGRQVQAAVALNAFESALALRLLALDEPGGVAERLLGRLLSAQGSDGSWESSAWLEFPNSAGGRELCSDGLRTLTTATVLRSLVRLCAATTPG